MSTNSQSLASTLNMYTDELEQIKASIRDLMARKSQIQVMMESHSKSVESVIKSLHEEDIQYLWIGALQNVSPAAVSILKDKGVMFLEDFSDMTTREFETLTGLNRTERDIITGEMKKNNINFAGENT